MRLTNQDFATLRRVLTSFAQLRRLSQLDKLQIHEVYRFIDADGTRLDICDMSIASTKWVLMHGGAPQHAAPLLSSRYLTFPPGEVEPLTPIYTVPDPRYTVFEQTNIGALAERRPEVFTFRGAKYILSGQRYTDSTIREDASLFERYNRGDFYLTVVHHFFVF